MDTINSSTSSIDNVPTSTMTVVSTRTTAGLRGLAKRHGMARDVNHAHEVRSLLCYYD